MLDLSLKIGAKDATLHLPTEIAEIGIDYLSRVTHDVKLMPNYALVALLVSEKLAVMCSTKNKKADVTGVGVLVKKNDPNKVCVAEFGEKLICAPTDIMMGNEVTSPANILSPGKITAMIAKDKELVANIFNYMTPVWLVTFKMVPLNAIHGSYRDVSDDEWNSMKSVGNKFLNV